jgi:RNA polymerase sigma factor (sigma-70 family)
MNDSKRDLSDIADEELMSLYVQGDFDAFFEIHERHSGRVFSFILKRAKRAEAEEVYQDTFLRLHRYRTRFDPSRPFLPWLFTLCRTALIERSRKSHPPRETLEDREKGIEEVIGASGESLAYLIDLNSTVKTLSNHERQILQLRFQRDLSFRDLARELGTTPAGARKALSRALQKLRELWR